MMLPRRTNSTNPRPGQSTFPPPRRRAFTTNTPTQSPSQTEPQQQKHQKSASTSSSQYSPPLYPESTSTQSPPRRILPIATSGPSFVRDPRREKRASIYRLDNFPFSEAYSLPGKGGNGGNGVEDGRERRRDGDMGERTRPLDRSPKLNSNSNTRADAGDVDVDKGGRGEIRREITNVLDKATSSEPREAAQGAAEDTQGSTSSVTGTGGPSLDIKDLSSLSQTMTEEQLFYVLMERQREEYLRQLQEQQQLYLQSILLQQEQERQEQQQIQDDTEYRPRLFQPFDPLPSTPRRRRDSRVIITVDGRQVEDRASKIEIKRRDTIDEDLDIRVGSGRGRRYYDGFDYDYDYDYDDYGYRYGYDYEDEDRDYRYGYRDRDGRSRTTFFGVDFVREDGNWVREEMDRRPGDRSGRRERYREPDERQYDRDVVWEEDEREQAAQDEEAQEGETTDAGDETADEGYDGGYDKAKSRLRQDADGGRV